MTSTTVNPLQNDLSWKWVCSYIFPIQKIKEIETLIIWDKKSCLC